MVMDCVFINNANVAAVRMVMAADVQLQMRQNPGWTTKGFS
jgi:hypothetical protein